jgi:hypothetical protein
MEKLDAAKMELNLDQFNLAQLMESVGKIIPEFAKVEIDAADNLQGMVFKLDRDRLPQALNHLATFLRLQAINPAEFHADVSVNDSGIVFKFKNSGPPLDEHIRKHMFDRYKDFSLDACLPPASAFHADLRLPLAALIICAHGGDLSFETTDDHANYCMVTLRHFS